MGTKIVIVLITTEINCLVVSLFHDLLHHLCLIMFLMSSFLAVHNGINSMGKGVAPPGLTLRGKNISGSLTCLSSAALNASVLNN